MSHKEIQDFEDFLRRVMRVPSEADARKADELITWLEEKQAFYQKADARLRDVARRLRKYAQKTVYGAYCTGALTHMTLSHLFEPPPEGYSHETIILLVGLVLVLAGTWGAASKTNIASIQAGGTHEPDQS